MLEGTPAEWQPATGRQSLSGLWRAFVRECYPAGLLEPEQAAGSMHIGRSWPPGLSEPEKDEEVLV